MKNVRKLAPLAIAVVAAAPACSSRAGSSVVTGYIAPCGGALRPAEAHAAGTVTALRGTTRIVRVSADQLREILPKDVAARSHTDGHEPFELRLAPGEYVLVGSYDEFPTTTAELSLRVPPSTTLQRDLPSSCK